MLLIIWAICIPAFLSTTASITFAEAPYTLRIGTMDLAPYGGTHPNGKKFGIVYQLHQEIGKRSGLAFTNEIYPFPRMVDMLKHGELDLLTAQPHTSTLDAGDQLIVQNKINLIAGTTKDSGLKSIEDLKGKHFIYILHASYPSLKDIPGNIYRVNNYKIMLKMLHDRTANEVGVFSEPAYYHWMNTMGFSPNEFGQAIKVAQREDWVFVRKDLPNAVREKLIKAVESMHRDKFYEKLFEKFKRGDTY